MKLMKRLLLVLSCSALACAGDLTPATNVYLLPMFHGLDQYLANRLTTAHVLQVVTEPKLADVILTDHIGQAFESQMATLLPLAKPPKASQPAPAASGESETNSTLAMFSDAAGKEGNPAVISSFSRTRGTIFLVNAKTHEVLWSTYEPPKNSTGKSLDHEANEIVSRLKKDKEQK